MRCICADRLVRSGLISRQVAFRLFNIFIDFVHIEFVGRNLFIDLKLVAFVPIITSDPLRGQSQAGSLTGAVHLLKNNAGVLRLAQRGQKPLVE